MSNILELLKFKQIGVGSVQTVDEMTVVPLVGRSDGEVASPQSLKFERTTSYGSMVFRNEDSKPAIVPTNYMVRGRGAQDHAMAGSGVVTAGRSVTFNNACCVEQTQGGYLSSTGNEEDVLPVGLRHALLNYGKRTEREYGKLWSDISAWIRGTGVSSRSAAHLRDFYDHKDVRAALEQFAAEFEPVDGQIGALIMFSGTPVGLEIMPTTDHWETYWQQLLRGCYGAELVRLKLMGKVLPSTLIMPVIPDDAAPDKVKEILDEFVTHLQEEIVPLIENITIKSSRRVGQSGGLETRLITTDTGGGDVILHDSKPVYISLVL